LVTGAEWKPGYRLDKNAGNTFTRVALVKQASGEDWSEVSLNLSIEPPLMFLSAPQSSQYTATRRDPVPRGLLNGMKTRQQAEITARTLLGSLQSGNTTGELPLVGTITAPKLTQTDKSLDQAANDVQWSESGVITTSPGGNNATPQDDPVTAADPSWLSFTGGIQQSVTVPNSLNNQVLAINSVVVTVANRKKNTAVPLLSSNVYVTEQIRNTSGSVFPAGPIAVYDAGRFIGVTEFSKPCLPGELAFVALGIDPKLRVSRTSRRSEHGNTIDVHCVLKVENYGSHSARIKITDPIAIAAGYLLSDPPRSAAAGPHPSWSPMDPTTNQFECTIVVGNLTAATGPVQVDYDYSMVRQPTVIATRHGFGAP
jgi:hypothetical protein